MKAAVMKEVDQIDDDLLRQRRRLIEDHENPAVDDLLRQRRRLIEDHKNPAMSALVQSDDNKTETRLELNRHHDHTVTTNIVYMKDLTGLEKSVLKCYNMHDLADQHFSGRYYWSFTLPLWILTIFNIVLAWVVSFATFDEHVKFCLNITVASISSVTAILKFCNALNKFAQKSERHKIIAEKLYVMVTAILGLKNDLSDCDTINSIQIQFDKYTAIEKSKPESESESESESEPESEPVIKIPPKLKLLFMDLDRSLRLYDYGMKTIVEVNEIHSKAYDRVTKKLERKCYFPFWLPSYKTLLATLVDETISEI